MKKEPQRNPFQKGEPMLIKNHFNLFLFFFLSFLIGNKAYSLVQLEAPDVLILQAKESRSDLRRVIFKISQNLSEFKDINELDPYIKIFPEIKALAIDFDLESIFPKMIDKLGEDLHSTAIKWLDPRFVSTEDILIYNQLSSFLSALRWLENIEVYLINENELQLLTQSIITLENVRVLFSELHSKRREVDLTIRRVMSNVSSKALDLIGNENDKLDFWISFLVSAQGFQEIINRNSESLFSLKRSDSSNLSIWFNQIIKIKTRAQSLQKDLPYYILQSIDDQIIDLIIKSVEFEYNLNEDLLMKSILDLGPLKLKALSQNFVYNLKTPSSQFINQYEKLIGAIGAQLENLNMESDYRLFTDFTNKIAATLKIEYLKAEGIYSLLGNDHISYRATLIRSQENRTILVLGHANNTFDRSYFHILYDVKSKRFFGSHRDPDIDPQANYSVSFRFNNKNELIIDDYFKHQTTQIIGKKIHSFPRLNLGDRLNTNLTGVYSGELSFLKKSPLQVELVINQLQGQISGQLRFIEKNKVTQSIELIIGSQSNENTIRLTSGRLVSGSIVHLRLFKNNNSLIGFFVAGARHSQSFNIQLTKKIGIGDPL